MNCMSYIMNIVSFDYICDDNDNNFADSLHSYLHLYLHF